MRIMSTGAAACVVATACLGIPARSLRAAEPPPAVAAQADVTPSSGTPSGRWAAPTECLYRAGEPRVLAPHVPPPPCDPSKPPNPYDLVGVAGVPTCGPIYRGPCEPRTGSHDDLHFWRLHRVWDRLFDWFYTPK